MIEVRQTDVFTDWFAGLRDREARARITVRIRRLSLGNPGNVKQWAAVYRKCGSITALAIGSILSAAATRLSSCSAAATSGSRIATSRVLLNWR